MKNVIVEISTEKGFMTLEEPQIEKSGGIPIVFRFPVTDMGMNLHELVMNNARRECERIAEKMNCAWSGEQIMTFAEEIDVRVWYDQEPSVSFVGYYYDGEDSSLEYEMEETIDIRLEDKQWLFDSSAKALLESVGL